MPDTPSLPDQLRDFALMALEESVLECRYRAPRPSYAIRFALLYLSATTRLGREPCDQFWSAIRQPHTPWSHTVADTALKRIYHVLGIERRPEVTARLGRRWTQAGDR